MKITVTGQGITGYMASDYFKRLLFENAHGPRPRVSDKTPLLPTLPSQPMHAHAHAALARRSISFSSDVTWTVTAPRKPLLDRRCSLAKAGGDPSSRSGAEETRMEQRKRRRAGARPELGRKEAGEKAGMLLEAVMIARRKSFGQCVE
ncbi:hypothetical protein GUITHDRAFT_104234 [Guillardia theta CCMP2712]|uniref:Uncharacterized protein n=1 Tax=Guillardia theta (strain CCMP2712) TaxID=905079 RepID=L1JP63_GUITC|nr:hypothetical protein GUITHDRAFT_104234 [Guillardia theta CCMP2712]EKX49838.1 hypothetical protein GUITHDRAFT_104234 [Guillardia theta CCMP2712]|eukprot:XP_005836818.1 hypothetical protein GUITHDRAFT_104234 [Guillardia theta CCMP2712]